MQPLSLTSSQRRFVRLVSQAAFSNPFSTERDDLDSRIANVSPETLNPVDGRRGDAVTETVETFLRDTGLISRPEAVHSYPEDDREHLMTAMLFRVFHRYCAALDDHVTAQNNQLDAPVAFAPGPALVKELSGFLSDVQVDRYIGIFFQLRRAWLFIGRQLAGSSAPVRHLRMHLWNNVFSTNMHWYEKYLCMQMESFSTMLLGATGTGKGTVASALGKSHYIPYDRQKHKFAECFARGVVTVNLAGIPETLLESELFGHKKGAFTGAIDHHTGVFGRTSPFGAVFIDEIGETAVATQVKLLRVLQERVFTPVGSREEEVFRGRIIAATNQDLHHLVEKGAFREDFYYRLTSDVIHLPNLKERFADDPSERLLLINHLLFALTKQNSSDLAAWVEERMHHDIPADYAWPGNVREFEQTVRRLLLTGTCRPHRQGATQKDPPPKSAAEVMQEYCRSLYEKFGSYEMVARTAGLDRRTVKKYISE